MFGTCVLQILRDTPSLIGGHVDANIRLRYWEDVSYGQAPVVLTVATEII